jgi:hypothetical protein
MSVVSNTLLEFMDILPEPLVMFWRGDVFFGGGLLALRPKKDDGHECCVQEVTKLPVRKTRADGSIYSAPDLQPQSQTLLPSNVYATSTGNWETAGSQGQPKFRAQY